MMRAHLCSISSARSPSVAGRISHASNDTQMFRLPERHSGVWVWR
jgi:hypothetical protein